MTIRELLDDLEVDYLESGTHHHTRPGWIQLKACPFCHSDNYHLGFNLALSYFVCWKCGSHRVFTVLEKLGVSRKDAIGIIGKLEAGELPKERKRLGLKEPAGRSPLQSAHLRYLEGRGFDPEALQRIWKIEGIGIAPRLSWRIYIPIIQRGVRVSWTTRAIGDRVEQRYVSASAEEEAVNAKHVIYGLDYCLHSVVVVEGPTDAWAVGPGAGATLGTAITSAQIRQLANVPYRFVCFDSSRAAQSRATELASQLSCFPGTTENVQLDADDPGSATQRELAALRRAARLG